MWHLTYKWCQAAWFWGCHITQVYSGLAEKLSFCGWMLRAWKSVWYILDFCYYLSSRWMNTFSHCLEIKGEPLLCSHTRGICICSQFSCSVVSYSLRPHRLQHTRLPCPSPTPRACSNSCLLSWWCHPTISSSIFSLSQHQGLLVLLFSWKIHWWKNRTALAVETIFPSLKTTNIFWEYCQLFWSREMKKYPISEFSYMKPLINREMGVSVLDLEKSKYDSQENASSRGISP